MRESLWSTSGSSSIRMIFIDSLPTNLLPQSCRLRQKRGRDRHGRQVNTEFGAFAGLAANGDLAVVVGDDPVHDRKPEPGPLADIFGREERLEDALHGHRVHAAAGIGDPDPDEFLAVLVIPDL